MAKNITGNGDTDFPHAPIGTEQLVLCTGSFGSGTIVVKIKDGNGDWVTYPTTDATKTAAFAVVFTVGPEAGVRLTMSGSTAPDVWANVGPVRANV